MLSARGLSNSSDTSLFLFDFMACGSNDFMDGRYIWAFCALVCFTLGFPASVIILSEMFKMWKRGTPITPNNFFILNLSIMDTVFLFFIPPGLVNNLTVMYWDFELFWSGIYALNLTGRPLLMTCICLDCYFAVAHPIVYHKRKSLKPRIVMAGIVWTVTTASGILYGISMKTFSTIIPYMPFIISMLIIGICDSLILSKIIKSSRSMNIHPQKQRSIHILINSLVTTVVSYLPPVILFAFVKLVKTHDKHMLCTVSMQVTITSTLGSAIMPLLYLNNIGKLDHLFACCRRS